MAKEETGKAGQSESKPKANPKGKPAREPVPKDEKPQGKRTPKKAPKESDEKVKIRCQISLTPEDRAKFEAISFKLNKGTGELVEVLVDKLIISQEKKMKAAGTHRTFMKVVKSLQA